MRQGAALATPRTQKFFSILPPDMVIGLQGRQGLQGSLRAADLRSTAHGRCGEERSGNCTPALCLLVGVDDAKPLSHSNPGRQGFSKKNRPGQERKATSFHRAERNQRDAQAPPPGRGSQAGTQLASKLLSRAVIMPVRCVHCMLLLLQAFEGPAAAPAAAAGFRSGRCPTSLLHSNAPSRQPSA